MNYNITIILFLNHNWKKHYFLFVWLHHNANYHLAGLSLNIYVHQKPWGTRNFWIVGTHYPKTLITRGIWCYPGILVPGFTDNRVLPVLRTRSLVSNHCDVPRRREKFRVHKPETAFSTLQIHIERLVWRQAIQIIVLDGKTKYHIQTIVRWLQIFVL